MGFPGGSAVKNQTAMEGTQEITDLIPGLERSPEGGHGNPLHIRAWRIPWAEETGGLQFVKSQRV